MKIKALAASIVLAYSAFGHAAPLINGNKLIDNNVIDRNLGYAKPKSIEEAARIIVGVYEQYGYLGVKASVTGNTITIIEPGAEVSGDYDKGWLPESDGVVLIGDIENSMAMADVNNRFETMDVVVGDLREGGKVDMNLQRSKSQKPYEASVSLSTKGQDTTARDLVTVQGATHVGGGVRVDAAYTQGLDSLRDESEGGEYKAARVSARKATQYGEFTLSGDISDNKVGGKEATRFDYEMAGETRRLSVGHRYSVQKVGTLTNALTWTKRSQDFGLFDATEEQDYKTWNVGYYGKFGAHQVNAMITKGLAGDRKYNLVPLMGSFNKNFYSAQLGYGTSGLISGTKLGYGLSGSYFSGSKDMPSAERMSVGGAGRGSSHVNGVVSGYKGYFGEARLYGMKAPVLSDYSLKPYVSINGGHTTDALGIDYEVIAAEVGLIGIWEEISSTVSYSSSLKEENVEKDSRLNLDLKYQF